MTEAEARKQTIKLFGEDSFTEQDFSSGMTRFYVGQWPRKPGKYTGFMGFSWDEALRHAADAENERPN